MPENPHVKQAIFIKSAVYAKDYPDAGALPELAIAGRSNVGKSSLINGLVNRRQLAKVSNTPGRTQLLNFFQIDDRFMLCDLPGYGYAKVPDAVRAGWGPMVETYLTQRVPLRGVLLLMDVRRTPGDWERAMVTWCSHAGRAVLPVVTKIDKLPVSKRKLAIAAVANGLGFQPRQVVGWSATSGEGLEDLWRRVVRLVEPAPAA
ncbi:MAG: YihA family ribosome biogenesis GTP-binding protein [Myxococcales bacterium]|nr:YihA family ribosome biogenesis GTP-binding protein [Myxococcales bacterium]